MLQINEELKKLVIKRLEVMPSNIKVSMGTLGTFSKEDLIKNVEDDTNLGKFVVKMQIEYLKSMSKGL
ncbi:MAG TPA: hypothetical protein VI968_00815 [archaeon]|nr:hypothetical protein [archaeon]